jgi:acetyl esterase/lipase
MDARAELDPEVAAAFDGTPYATLDFGTYTFADMPSVRDMMDNAPRPPLPPTSTVSEERSADGVPVWVFTPAAAVAPAPVVLFVHGGGFFFGRASTSAATLNAWADAFGCVIVSVEYRLAPEHPYPAPLEDCYTALKWVAAHADELGVDAGTIVVAGQSAGGGLAAGLALLARDRGEVQIAYQLLIYPMLDDRGITPSSRRDAVVWSPGANVLGWRAYLGDLYGRDDVPAYAAPSRATDLRGLPPAFIAVGTADGFCDEDIAYALALLAAGVPTELHVYPGAPHGFEAMLQDAAVARRARRDIADALGRALSRRPPS